MGNSDLRAQGAVNLGLEVSVGLALALSVVATLAHPVSQSRLDARRKRLRRFIKGSSSTDEGLQKQRFRPWRLHRTIEPLR